MKITVYASEDYDDVVTKATFQEVVHERTIDQMYDYDDVSTMIRSLVRDNTDFNFFDLLTAQGEELERVRQMVNEGFEKQTRDSLLSDDWKEFELELSEEDVVSALRTMSKEEIIRLYLSAIEGK